MMTNQLATIFNDHLSQLLTGLIAGGQSTTPATPRLVVALSGGVDSVVLLHLLVQYKLHQPNVVVIAHNVNHGLSANAASWADFCGVLCEQLKVPLLTSKVMIKQQTRSSLEALAREARYQSFQDKMHEHDIILTGHHQDDQLETLLLALKRGSGSTGLQGIQSIQPFHDGYLIRPLLVFSRQQIMDYAAFHQLTWVEDESNQNIDFDRNFIRQKISPLLIERWPSIAQSASRTAQLCQDQQHLLDEFAEQDLRLCSVEPFSKQTVSIATLNDFSSPRRNNVLRHWLKSNGLQYPSSKQLGVLWDEVALAQFDKQPSLNLISHSVCRYQSKLYLVPNKTIKIPNEPVKWSGESTLWLSEGYLGVNFSKVEPAIAEQHRVTCCLRPHLDPALICSPEGRSKPRSIKKLLHEYNVPPWQRDEVVFIFVDNQLVEALGIWKCQRKTTDKVTIPTLDLSLYST
jgi:tRNA(Ile)-lysidine synthase